MERTGALPVSDLAKKCGDVLMRLNTESEPILLTRRGRSVAVLVDLDTYAMMDKAARGRPQPDTLGA